MAKWSHDIKGRIGDFTLGQETEMSTESKWPSNKPLRDQYIEWLLNLNKNKIKVF